MRIDIYNKGKYVDTLPVDSTREFDFKREYHVLVPNCSLLDLNTGDEIVMVWENSGFEWFRSSYTVAEENEDYWVLHTPEQTIRMIGVAELKNMCCSVEVAPSVPVN